MSERKETKERGLWTDEEWEIYALGMKFGKEVAERDNEIALSIGRAIVYALDNRYESKNEDY